jgi:ATP-dependent Clp protease protease subunit
MAKRFDVKGYIVPDDDKWIYDLLEIGAVSHNDIKAFLEEANGEDIELMIDSPGGVVRIASDIYSELRSYAGNSTAYIMGISASASSILMLGAQKVVAFPTARVMIHNAQSAAEGDYREMEQAAVRLKKANDSIINAYQIKTGMSRKDLQDLMDKNTWMTAQEAKNYGFVDEIALKDGENLDEIAAALPLPMSVAPILNMEKMHEFAMKYKEKPEELQKEDEKDDESGGGSRPVSLIEQKQRFYNLKMKLYH